MVSSAEVSAILYAGLVAIFGRERVSAQLHVKRDSNIKRGARVNVALLSHDHQHVIAAFECKRQASESYAPSARAQRVARLLNAPAVTVRGMASAARILRALEGIGEGGG